MDIEIDGLAWIKNSDLTEDMADWIKRNLTITQKVSKEYAKRSKPAIVQLWSTDDKDRIGIPREFFFDQVRRNHNVTYSCSNGDPWPDRIEDVDIPQEMRSSDKTVLTLYDSVERRPVSLKKEQAEAMQAMISHFANRQASGCLIQAGTGWGKTMLGIALARELKLKTAVIVHRKFLLQQWKSRIERFLPDAKIGVIAGKEWDVDGAHIVMVMVETVASWAKKGKVPPELRDMFGLVIADEVHRMGAPWWCTAIPVFNSTYRMGISAHPRRSDGLDKAFFYHIGPKVYTGVTLSRIPKIRRVYTNYNIKHQRANLSFMSMEYAFKLMSADVNYNQDVLDQIKLALEKGRKILVYSHTVKHLQYLKNELDSQWKQSSIKTDYYIGGRSDDELAEAEAADVIFATYMMAKDSLDIPALDTVVLAAPVRNPTQPAGRCCRDYPNKKDPIVVDMRADNVHIFKEYGESRDRVYEKIYSPKPAASDQASLEIDQTGDK